MLNFISKEDIPWALAFVRKVLIFFAIIDLGILPILLILQIDLGAYFLIILYEGFCLVFLGGSLLFVSLFSTSERDDYRHVGNGFFRRDVVVRRLGSEDKRRMRQKGVIMIMLGFFFWTIGSSILRLLWFMFARVF